MNYLFQQLLVAGLQTVQSTNLKYGQIHHNPPINFGIHHEVIQEFSIHHAVLNLFFIHHAVLNQFFIDRDLLVIFPKFPPFSHPSRSSDYFLIRHDSSDYFSHPFRSWD